MAIAIATHIASWILGPFRCLNLFGHAAQPFLDALRGIAAILVLLTHLQLTISGFYLVGWLASRPDIRAKLAHGEVGVDVFFLISEFIVFVAARRVIHAGRGVRLFLLKRFLRIFLPIGRSPWFWLPPTPCSLAFQLLPIRSR